MYYWQLAEISFRGLERGWGTMLYLNERMVFSSQATGNFSSRSGIILQLLGFFWVAPHTNRCVLHKFNIEILKSTWSCQKTGTFENGLALCQWAMTQNYNCHYDWGQRSSAPYDILQTWEKVLYNLIWCVYMLSCLKWNNHVRHGALSTLIIINSVHDMPTWSQRNS